MPNISIIDTEGGVNGGSNGQAFMGPPWMQAEDKGPPWYQTGLTWFKNDFGGAWWWKAYLGVSPVGPKCYQNGVAGPAWYQDPINGPWWASMLP